MKNTQIQVSFGYQEWKIQNGGIGMKTKELEWHFNYNTVFGIVTRSWNEI